jgi:signal transduction histidine kinase
VHDLGMRSVICAPIVAREQIIGVIHLDCPVTRHTYSEHELRLIAAIGYQTGLAIENARLVQSHLRRERLAAAGETTAYLSHHITNILQGMRGGAEIVKRGLDARDFAVTTKGWGIVERNLEKTSNLMLNMLAFSKDRAPRMEMLQVNKVVDDVVNLCQKSADDAGAVLLADLDETLPPIPLDYDGLHQVLLNIVTNAIDAVEHRRGIISVRTRYDASERRVTLSVADNGPGVPEAERIRIFEPFHSTKGHGGTGLGLAVARKIVTEMGGTLELISPPDGGAEFAVRLSTIEGRRAKPGDTHGPTPAPD